MPPIPEPRKSGFTTTTPVPLYWAAYGPEGAPRLLVVHGGPGAHHDYLLPQMLALAERYELIFYDQRGGGQSKTEDRSPSPGRRTSPTSASSRASWRESRSRSWGIRGVGC